MEDESRKVEDDENDGKVTETPKDKGNETKSSTMNKRNDESDNRTNTNLKVAYLEDTSKQTNEVIYLEDTKNQTDEVTYMEDTKNKTDEVTYLEDTRKQTNEVTYLEDTRKQTNEVTYLEDTRNQTDEVTYLEDTRKQTNEVTYLEDTKNQTDEVTYLEDTRKQTNEVTYLEDTRNQTDEVTYLEETKNLTDEVTYLEDTRNQTDDNGMLNLSVTRDHRPELKETKHDEAAVDMMSKGSSEKENETAELVNYPLSPISKSSRGEEDLYLNENDDGKELDQSTSSSNSSEHSPTNQMYTSSIQNEKQTSEGVSRDLEDRKATVSSSGDVAKPPMKNISKPVNASDYENLEVDGKDEQSSRTSSDDSYSEFRFTNGEKGKDKLNKSYDKLSHKHGELQQQEDELGTNNNKEKVGTNNSSFNKDEKIPEQSEYTAEMSMEHDTIPNEGISNESAYTGQKLQTFSDQQKFEPMAEKKDISKDSKGHGSRYSKNSENDKKSLVKDTGLDLAVKRKNSQIQFRNNAQTQSKSSSQTQSGSGIQTRLKSNFRNNDKQTPNAGIPVSARNVQSIRSSSRNSVTLRRTNESTLSGKEIVATQNRRRMTKSARPTLLQMKKRPETRSSRPYSQARTEVSQDGKKKQEFFRLELRRIKTGLEKEASKIKRPKERDYYPFVWTSLAPYYDTTTAQYLIPLDNEEDKDKEQKDGKEEVTDEKHTKKRNPEMEKLAYEKSIRAYLTRNTAIGLCDPWVDLNMDKRFLEFPKIETPEEKQKKQAEEGSSAEKGEKSKKTRPPKEGSTRLPKFPVITLDKKELATKPLHYNDVPMLRSEFEASFSLKSKERMRKDYKRTKEDFYRMELDRLNEIHKRNRPHMRQAYFAYLQNTPGSREAIYDCMVESGFTKKKNNTPEKPRNESPTSQKVEVKA